MTAAGKETEKNRDLVFISYATEKGDPTKSDRQVADMIYSALQSKGIRGWVAHRDIGPGMNWPDEISKAIAQSKIMVLVLSSNTQQSRYVNMEVTQAADENIIIIPFCIEEVPLRGGLKLLLGNRHWINAFPDPQQEHLDQLGETVFRHLGIEPETNKIKPVVKDVKAVKEKIKDSADMPEDVKKVISKAHKVDKNKNGYWEAYYQDGIVMVYIPPGEFMMGQTGEEKKWLIDQIGEKEYNSYYSNETPLHKVYLDGYWIGKYEVTFAQYDQYCQETKIEKSDGEGWGRENRPVINVSWTEAAANCEWLSQKTGLKFKLPTEAQWEKAARGNDQHKYPWGSRELDKNFANFNSNIGKTTPVGSYPAGASPYGLLDMAGNVWEWCEDWYDDYYYKSSPPQNPPGPESGSNHVIPGGCWYYEAGYLRCASRGNDGPSSRDFFVGFRLCQDI